MCLLLLLPHTLTLLWPWVCPCRQSFKNCSSLASFLRVQSCRNRLPQHRSPMGLQILPEKLLRGLLSMGPARSLFQQGFSIGSSFLQGTSICSSRGSSMVCTMDICLPVGTSSVPEGLRFGNQWVGLGADWSWLRLSWGQLLVSHSSQPCSQPLAAKT